MRIPRIHTGQPLQAGASFDLEPGPSQHIARVLRMRAGDALILFDGLGGEFPAIISVADKKTVTVTTGQGLEREAESPLAIHLGIAVSRGERMDFVVQKATELGATEITPLFTQRTEVRLKGEREEKKLAHWRQVAISACEQCGRNRLPQVHPLVPLESWLAKVESGLKLVLHHRADEMPVGDQPPAGIALLVGPEGGLADTEIAAAEAAGFLSLALGPRVLRTETAPLAALAVLQARWGDMRL